MVGAINVPSGSSNTAQTYRLAAEMVSSVTGVDSTSPIGGRLSGAETSPVSSAVPSSSSASSRGSMASGSAIRSGSSTGSSPSTTGTSGAGKASRGLDLSWILFGLALPIGYLVV